MDKVIRNRFISLCLLAFAMYAAYAHFTYVPIQPSDYQVQEGVIESGKYRPAERSSSPAYAIKLTGQELGFRVPADRSVPAERLEQILADPQGVKARMLIDPDLKGISFLGGQFFNAKSLEIEGEVFLDFRDMAERDQRGNGSVLVFSVVCSLLAVFFWFYKGD